MMMADHDSPVIYSPEIFSIQNYGGVSRSVMEIIRAIARRHLPWQVWAGRHGSEPLEALIAELNAQNCVFGRYQATLPGRFAAVWENERGFNRFLQNQPKTVIHRTQYPAVDMIPKGFRKVLTLHDMWTERENRSPMDRVRSEFKRRALENSDAIVCISHATYDNLAQNWPHLIDRARVIHHGARILSDVPIAPVMGRPFFLYVGQREERKNFATVLKSLAAARHTDEFYLVCAGGGAFSKVEMELIHQLGLNEQIVQISVNDDELAGLYENAIALLYPSRFEGFGMPLLEAMLHGCPVVSSPVSCMPEIAGDAAVYADADQPEAWADALERLAFDPQWREQLTRAGREHATGFSWDRAGASYDTLYRSLM